MIIASLLAAAVTAAQPTPAPSYARAAVEMQLQKRPVRGPATGLTGAEAQAMRQAYLQQLSEKRDAPQTQNVIARPAQ